MKPEMKLAIANTVLLAFIALMSLVLVVRQRDSELDNIQKYEALYNVTNHLANDSREQIDMVLQPSKSVTAAEREENKKTLEKLQKLLDDAVQQRNKSRRKVLTSVP